MRKQFALGIIVGCAIAIAGYAQVSQAGCCGDCGQPCVTCCDPCCPPPCGCPGGPVRSCVGDILHAPFDVAKWALRVIGGGCPCGGCDQEIYWGDYCPEPDPCCNHCGGCGQKGPSYGAPVEGGVAPHSGMIIDPTPAPCNCNQGGVTRSSYPASRQQATVVRQSPARYASYPTQSERPTTSASAPRTLPVSYSSDPRYSASQRYSSSPRYSQGPSYSEAPRYTGSTSGTSADMYRPRLISVTDRVVTPAGAPTATAATPEIER